MLRWIFVPMFLLTTALPGQDGLQAQVVDPSDIPDEIRLCVRSNPSLQLDGSINPFYISGDYDGDGITDFAALVRDPRDRGPGIHHILFCFGRGKSVLWDAGIGEDN